MVQRAIKKSCYHKLKTTFNGKQICTPFGFLDQNLLIEYYVSVKSKLRKERRFIF